MKILGVSGLYHDSAAALCIDGKIIVAAQEERFIRKKADRRIPRHAMAYCLSMFEEATVITVDGVGEWATTIGIGKGENSKLLKQLNYPQSLGLLYSAFTFFCRFKVNTGEYKMMGLAPYGESKYVVRYEYPRVKKYWTFVIC